MAQKKLKVITECGSSFVFEKKKNGVIKVIVSTPNAFFENEVLNGSMEDVKEGELLKFDYYAGLGREKFTSSSPIITIEKL